MGLGRIIIIALVVFILALSTFIAVIIFKRHKRKDIVVKKSFGRSQAPEGVGIHDVRKHGTFDKPEKKEGRGRLYAFGIVIAGIFGALIVRLWSLQLISSEDYQKQAEENMTSEVSLAATRGRILDRNGKELVGNRPSLCVVAAKSVSSDPIVTHMLSLVLGIPLGVVRKNILDDSAGAQADRTIATDVPIDAVSYIKEHQQFFAGVSVEERTVRTYPNGSLAAHVLGYIGPVTNADLLLPQHGIIYESGDLIGKDGAEYAFEGSLQGIRGSRTYQVDAEGNPLVLLSESPPINGSDVCLTLDIDLQKATDQIIQDVIESSHERGFPTADTGAIVCLDIKDGGVLASTSYPAYLPSEFTNGISTDSYDQLLKDPAKPLLNRVISGLYPAASTYKAFSSLAGLKYGIIQDGTEHTCTGNWEAYGAEWSQKCWIWPSGHGTLGLEEAINQSCDVFFYNVADGFFQQWNTQNNLYQKGQSSDPPQDILQDYLKTWGFGSITGVDISNDSESAGVVPTPTWKLQTFPDTPEDAQWQGGDMTNMIIGQGFVLVTPLQIANGYAGIARRKMLKPHFFYKVLNDEGKTVVSAEPEDSDIQPEIIDKHIDRVEDGLRRVIQRLGGPFDQLPVTVAGKSGTAEHNPPEADSSWFVAFAPADDPQYCVACFVDHAGDGSSAAVLGVQHTLAAIYGVDIGEIVVYEGSRER